MSTPPKNAAAPEGDALSADDTCASGDALASTVVSGSSLRPPEEEPGAGSDYPHLGRVDPEHYLRGRELARGGMGCIVEARDRRLGRPVAVKELLVDSPGFRARFEREARITARLQHPSIVDIHEAGVWPGGEPFFAMKLVAGRPLDRVIQEARTLPERLALLPTVIAAASAMAYAHRRRVIHRDLKPGNVLVGDFGETVVIDWGLAKDLSQEEPDGLPSLPPAATPQAATVVGAVMGTPGYMPPEQARGEPVDERADVYALGAMLYHLLAGAPPYAAPTSAELLEQVRHGPPPPLQARAPGVPRDLLTIVETAMARERAARYRTAKELADDLARFQTGQLVASHHYTRRQLVGRWVRQNARAVAVAAAAVVVLLVAGGLSLQRVLRERARAEASRAEAEALVEFMVVDLRQKLEPLGRLELLDTVARKAEAYYEHRVEALGPEEQLRRSIAHSSLGEVLRAEGDTSGALAEYQKELSIAQALVETDGASVRSRVRLGIALFHVAETLAAQGDLEGGLAHYRRSLELRERLVEAHPDAPVGFGLLIGHLRIGEMLARRGDTQGALDAYRTALALAENRARAAPDDDATQYWLSQVIENIGSVAAGRGDIEEALARFRAALEIRARLVAKHPLNVRWQRDLSRVRGNLGNALRVRGEFAEALAELRAALAIDERLVEQEPANTSLRRDLAVDHTALGDLLLGQGELNGALSEYLVDMDITTRLAARDPKNSDWQKDLGSSHMQVGDVLAQQGELTRAMAEYRAALAIRAGLAAKDPTNLGFRSDEASAHSVLGDVLRAQKDAEGALAEYRTSLALEETLVAADPKNEDWADGLATTHADLSEALLAQGHAEAALTEARRALELRQRLTAERAENGDSQENLGEARAQVAAALVATRSLEEARTEYRAAAEVFEALASKDQSNVQARQRAAELRGVLRTCCGPSRPGR